MNQFSNKCDQTFVFLGQNNVLHFYQSLHLQGQHCFRIGQKRFYFSNQEFMHHGGILCYSSCCEHDLYSLLVIHSKALHFDSKSFRTLWISSLEVE